MLSRHTNHHEQKANNSEPNQTDMHENQAPEQLKHAAIKMLSKGRLQSQDAEKSNA